MNVQQCIEQSGRWKPRRLTQKPDCYMRWIVSPLLHLSMSHRMPWWLANSYSRWFLIGLPRFVVRANQYWKMELTRSYADKDKPEEVHAEFKSHLASLWSVLMYSVSMRNQRMPGMSHTWHLKPLLHLLLPNLSLKFGRHLVACLEANLEQFWGFGRLYEAEWERLQARLALELPSCKFIVKRGCLQPPTQKCAKFNGSESSR